MPHILLAFALLFMMADQVYAQDDDRMRAREAGVEIGVLPTGEWNAITDVEGVRVGHETVIKAASIRTGVTAILPHEGNVFQDRVPAALHVANGFGKTVGQSQVQELGELETPILLTCTLCVWRAADALAEIMLEQSGMENVRSINPVIGETNDGYLNDIRSRPISREHVEGALNRADTGPVEEGSVGAGTGTRAFGWKSGIGTSSRALPESLGGHTVGVLVQTNFGGVLQVDGAPVGEELGQYIYRNHVEGEQEDGSVMIVVATDAPLDARQLERLSRRAIVGLSRTGATMTHGSGDYVIAFSTTRTEALQEGDAVPLSDGDLSPLFQAVAESTEEAIINSLFKANTMDGDRGTMEALPLDETLDVLRRYRVIE